MYLYSIQQLCGESVNFVSVGGVVPAASPWDLSRSARSPRSRAEPPMPRHRAIQDRVHLPLDGHLQRQDGRRFELRNKALGIIARTKYLVAKASHQRLEGLVRQHTTAPLTAPLTTAAAAARGGVHGGCRAFGSCHVDVIRGDTYFNIEIPRHNHGSRYGVVGGRVLPNVMLASITLGTYM